MLNVIEARISNTEFIVPPNKFESILMGKGMVTSVRRDDLTVGDLATVFEGNNTDLTGNQIEVEITEVKLVDPDLGILKYGFRLNQVKVVKVINNGKSYLRNVHYLHKDTATISIDKQKGKYIRMHIDDRPMVGDIIVITKEQYETYENTFIVTSISEVNNFKGRVEVVLLDINFWEELGKKR